MAVRFKLVIDCRDPEPLAHFWAAAKRGVGRSCPNTSELPFAVQRQRGSPADPSGRNPMHQQPPKTPLLRSTNVANAAHVD
jgi:hypothetical protein